MPIPSAKTKLEKFLKGKPISYSAKRKCPGKGRLEVTLTLEREGKAIRSEALVYTSKIQTSWTDGGITHARIGQTYYPRYLHTSSSFAVLFNEMVNDADAITHMLRLRTGYGGPSQSDLIRCIHAIQDKVEAGFLKYFQEKGGN